jgi:SAM-dependent methyltransferase
MAPMPPVELRFNVAGTRDEALFDQLGRRSVEDFSQALAGVGRSLGEFSRILEWGCGCGRILRHLTFDPARQEVHGCDIDPKGIEWLQANLPDVQVLTNGGLPPLPYPDGHFDLIINHSVLTHLDERYQDAWLAEIRRVLRPDGLAILTVHGPFAYQSWIANLPTHAPELSKVVAESRRALESTGIYFFVDDAWAHNFPEYYQSTFHAPWYVFDHWKSHFDIVSYIPRGSLKHQDMIVLRHLQPDPQPQPKVAEDETARLREELEALRSSTSWRMTAPLRQIVTWMRGR